MNISIKNYQELTKDELYSLLKLRTDVFVVEQNCPYPELDNKDQLATHVLAKHNSQLVTYARVFKPNDYFDGYAAIGRLVTDSNYRGQQFATEIMQASLDYCYNLNGKNTNIKISAQTYLISFYETFKFKTIGEEFLEDNLPHIYMIH